MGKITKILEELAEIKSLLKKILGEEPKGEIKTLDAPVTPGGKPGNPVG